MEGLVRRFFNYGKEGGINDIFAIYENHNYNPFSMRIVNDIHRTDLWDMISDYIKMGFDINSLLEEAPLLFLIEQIPKIKNVDIRISRTVTSGNITSDVLLKLKEKFVAKMQSFIDTFQIVIYTFQKPSQFGLTAVELFYILLACNPHIGGTDKNGIEYIN
jgi:hypothetical protein